MTNRALATVAATLYLSLLTACDKPTAEAPPPLAVLVREVGQQSAVPLTIYTGEVRARHETDLSFRVGGKLVARNVEVGDAVRKGAALARLDPQDLRLSAEAARDQLSAAEAELSLARSELDRARQLVAQNFMSESVLDSRRTAVEGAEARVRQARAQSELTANQAGYTVLKAEHDAVVLAVLADRGEVVAAGQPVLRLARQDEREVLIHVPEGRVAGISVGMPAQVRPLADTERHYAAQVREMAAAADAATRTFAVRLSIEGADERLPLAYAVNGALVFGPILAASSFLAGLGYDDLAPGGVETQARIYWLMVLAAAAGLAVAALKRPVPGPA